MAVQLDLKAEKKLIDPNFESYRLSLDPLPILKQTLNEAIECFNLGDDQYGFLHAHLASLVNHLFQDPWAQNSVFFVTEARHVVWTCLLQDGRLSEPKTVWRLPSESAKPSANVTISFSCQEWAIVNDGTGNVYILNTPCRGEGEPWQVCHSYTIEESINCSLVLHSIYRAYPSVHQVECLLVHVSPIKNVRGSEKLPEDNNVQFICVLDWLTFSCVTGSESSFWNLKRERRLLGRSVPQYAAYERTGEAIILISEKPFIYVHDTLKEIRQELERKSPPPPPLPLYSYIQSLEDVTLIFKLGDKITPADISVEMKPSYFELKVKDKAIISGPLWGVIDQSSSTWTIENSRLEVLLTKAESGQMWQEVVKGNKQGEEMLDLALVEEIHNRLAHLTSDTEACYAGRPGFNELEDCDISLETIILQRLDGETHQATHQINLAGHQWLFSSIHSPDLLPIFCMRHDVDGLVWQPKNVISEGEPEHFKVEHVATYPAFGYVLASKQDKKFVAGSPNFGFAAVSDAVRHVYIYRQPEMLNSAIELRNRKTGQEVSRIAKQHVVNVEQCDVIVGMCVSRDCVFVLGKKAIFAIKVHEN